MGFPQPHDHPWTFMSVPGPSWATLGPHGPFGTFLGPLGASMGTIGASMGSFGASLGLASKQLD